MFPHPPGRASDVEHDRSVHEPVQDGGGHDGVAEDVAPFGQAPVGGDDGRVPEFVAAVDDLEEGGGLGPCAIGIEADVVDDEDGRRGVGLEFVGEGALDAGRGRGCGRVRRRR